MVKAGFNPKTFNFPMLHNHVIIKSWMVFAPLFKRLCNFKFYKDYVLKFVLDMAHGFAKPVFSYQPLL